MKTKLALWIVGLSLLGAAPAFATGTSLNFNNPTTLSGNTATYTFDSHTITATGYQCKDNTLSSCSSAGVTLATENHGIGDTGLGIMGSGAHGDNEIDSSDFVQLDFSQFASLGITSLTFQIESVQNSEGFRMFESNTAGMPGTPMLTVTGNGTNNPSGVVTETVSVNFANNAYIDFSALKSGGGTNDVLLGSLSAQSSSSGGGPSPTPEPGTLVLFGTGMLLVGGVMRRYLPHSA